jgi:hypothetical protein
METNRIKAFQVRPESNGEREKFIMAAFECGYDPSICLATRKGNKYEELISEMPWFGFPVNLANKTISKVQPFSRKYGIEHTDDYPLMTIEKAIEYMDAHRLEEETN